MSDTSDTNALIEEIETHTDFPLSHINLWTDLCKAIRTLTKQLEQLHQARFVKTVDEKAWLRIGGKDVVMLPGDTIEGLWTYTPPEQEVSE